MQLDVEDLPPELWHHILEHLPRPDQRTCRLVCRAFHGLATAMVFDRVVVTFGDWDIWDAFNGETMEGTVVTNSDAQAQREARTLAILDHFVADPWFAGMVKHLEVHAFEMDDGLKADTTSLMARLTAAVRTLRQLHSFVWQGQDPSLPLTLVEALSTSCPFLRILSVPMKSLPHLPLTTFRTLHTISITDAEYTRDTITHTLSTPHCTTELPYLHTLQLPYALPADIPLDRLPHLTHLELVSMHAYTGFGALLRSVPRLQSLALFSPVHERDQAAIFGELAAVKAHLPHLAALALQGPTPRVSVVSPPELAQLCEFLRGRVALRRLYLTFEIATADLGVWLGTVKTLPNMEIFDLRMQDQPLDRAFLSSLTRYLPPTLSAMKLTSGGHLVNKDAFDDFWAHFTALGFLYVRTWEATAVSVQDVVCGARKLELVGYNGLFHDVQYARPGAGADADAHLASDSDSDPGADVEPLARPPWSARRTALRGVDDFRCEGWEWLMRHLTIVP